MNINPLANQKRPYRFLVVSALLASSITVSWIIAQLFLLSFSAVSSEQQLSEQILRLEKSILEQTYVLPIEGVICRNNHFACAQQTELIEKHLKALTIRINNQPLDTIVRRNYLRRCELLQYRLDQRKLELAMQALEEELRRVERGRGTYKCFRL